MRRRLSAALLTLGCLLATAGAEGVRLPSPDGIATGALRIFEDPSGEATLEQVLQTDRFVDAMTTTPNFNFTSSAYWFRFRVENRGDRERRLFLDIQHPTLDYVTLHVLRSNGRHEVVESGDKIPARARPINGSTLILPFLLGEGEATEVLIKVRSEAGAIIVPMRLVDREALQNSMLARRTLHGGLLGLFVALFLYNLLLFVSLPDRTHVYYVIYLPFALLTITSLDGFGAELLYPDWTWPDNSGLPVIAGTTFFLIVSFARAFLRTKQHPDLDRWLLLLLVASALLAASPLALPVRVSFELGMIMVFVFPLVSGAVGAVAWRRGLPEARYFVLGQVASWFGVEIFGMVVFGLLPFNLLLFESISLGIAADALLLALALAHRIRLLQKAKLVAERTLLLNLQERKDELERVVAARTAELDAARKKAEWLAVTDPLTGAANRRGVSEQVEREIKIALRHQRPLALVMLDLDHFKKINDVFGHGAGDKVLRDVVSTVRSVVREIDLLGRIGGEEFLLVLPDTTEQAAAIIAERVRERIAKKVSVGTPPHAVTASLGVTSLTPLRSSLQSLMTAADTALYIAKERGRNRVAVSQRKVVQTPATLLPQAGADSDLFSIGEPFPVNS